MGEKVPRNLSADCMNCQQFFLLTYHLLLDYPHMSLAKPLHCKADPRETKEGVINSQALPQTASTRSIRAPCFSCESKKGSDRTFS